MAYKQDAPPEPIAEPIAMAGWQVLEVVGIDAAAFLQAQLMNDVGALAPHHWQWNGWLNPKGRLIALFALIALDENTYWLLPPDFPAVDLAVRLQRFVFRSKLTMRARDDFGAFADFEPALVDGASNSNPSMVIGEAESGLALDFGTTHTKRTLGLQPRSGTSGSTPIPLPDAEVELRWRALDLAHGLPRLPIEQSEQWTPQMLSLDRIDAYSLKKGCYPGQEIVARTHYLGHAKRGLVRITGDRLQVGAEIRADGRLLGTIISCMDANGAETEALAVLSAERPDSGWECSGAPCRELPLLDGLAR
jgi:folate-binding protein YgfZ